MSKSPEEEAAEQPTSGGVNVLTTLEYFQKMYGKSMDGADQKAVKVFKDYESHEKVRRLQNELMWIKEGKASETACNRVVGKKRKAKYQSYARWAELMLIWMSQHKK